MPSGQFLLLIQHAHHEFEIRLNGEPIHISGIFAQSLQCVLKQKAQASDQQRLKIIEQQHPKLKGLSQAKIQPEQLQKLVMGQSLGMLFIELTDQCNERCIHCYASSSPACHNFLSLNEIKTVLEHARSLGKAFIQFTGGDPLIHRQLLEAVQYASQLDFQGIEIYTNGLLLSDPWLNKLRPYKPRLCFSIYSDQAACHDGITQVPGSWKKTLHAMQQAKQAGFDIRAGVAIMPENIASLEAMPAFLKEQLNLEPEHIRFDPVKQTGRGKLMQGVEQILVAPSHAQGSAHERRGKLCVSATGDVFPCIFSRQHALGNIRQQPLSEIIHKLQQQSISTGSLAYWQSCRDSLSCGDCQMIAYALGEQHSS